MAYIDAELRSSTRVYARVEGWTARYVYTIHWEWEYYDSSGSYKTGDSYTYPDGDGNHDVLINCNYGIDTTEDFVIYATAYQSDGQRSAGPISGTFKFEDEIEWTRNNTGNYYDIEDIVELNNVVGSYEIDRYRLSFAESGTVKIYSTRTASIRLYTCIGNDASFDSSDGFPYGVIREGSGYDVGYQFTATAGTTYYLWIRPFDGEDYGRYYITVEPPNTGWKLSSSSAGTVSTVKSLSYSISAYTLYRVTAKFSDSGIVAFYSSGSLDMIGYYGISTEYSTSTGTPTYTDMNDDGGEGTNFKLEFNVVAGTTYYLWFRCYDGNATGDTTVTIVPPASGWQLITESLGALSSSWSSDYAIPKSTTYCLEVKFDKSGRVKFYSTGSTDTIGFYGTSNIFDTSTTTGYPLMYSAMNDDGGENLNFSLEFTVTANTTYYLWFTTYKGTGGSTTIYIIPPATGGNCYVYISGYGWRHVTPYVYVSGYGWREVTPNVYVGSTGWRQT